MDPISVIMAAVAVGASKGVGEAASQAVQDSYAALKSVLARRLSGDVSRELTLEKYQEDQQTWEAPFAKALRESAAADDPEVVSLAQRLLALLDAAGTEGGKYVVDSTGSRGVQIGERNEQTNHFVEKD